MLFTAFKFAFMAEDAVNKNKVVDSIIYEAMSKLAFKKWKKSLDVKLLNP